MSLNELTREEIHHCVLFTKRTEDWYRNFLKTNWRNVSYLPFMTKDLALFAISLDWRSYYYFSNILLDDYDIRLALITANPRNYDRIKLEMEWIQQIYDSLDVSEQKLFIKYIRETIFPTFVCDVSKDMTITVIRK